MKQLFYIDGGAGRIIAAIPALLKFNRLNPNADWNVLIPAWDNLLWSIPELQDRVYSLDTKGLFENTISKADVIHSPEPYRVPGYFNQKLSLAQAFDKEINKTDDHSDLGPPIMMFNKNEKLWAKNTIEEAKAATKKSKTIIFQPYGSGAAINNKDVVDTSSRSLSVQAFLSLSKKLSARYNVVFFGEPQLQVPEDTITLKVPNADLRMWASLIDAADYFVGVDSVGQHMARAVGTPGSVIFGSTFPVNTSYPDYFNIIDNGATKKYSPIRIAGLDVMLSNRLNENTMNFNDKELNDIYNSIVQDIERKVK
jgi:ADP-heptose:LPS heptosyltransferase